MASAQRSTVSKALTTALFMAWALVCTGVQAQEKFIVMASTTSTE